MYADCGLHVCIQVGESLRIQVVHVNVQYYCLAGIPVGVQDQQGLVVSQVKCLQYSNYYN